MGCEKYDKLTLLSYIAGDLSPKDGSEVAGHLEQCETCSAFVEEAEQQQQQFLNEFPEAPRLTVMKKAPKRIVRPGYVLALAASFLVVLGGTGVLMRQSQPVIRTKGAIDLGLYVLNENGQPVKREENIYYPGERMQFTYSCGDRCFFILLSCDTAGTVTRYYPIEGDVSTEVESGANKPLSHSIQLDDYIGNELYIAVFSAHPLILETVIKNVKSEVAKTDCLHDVSLSIDDAVVKLVPLVKKRRL